jgi:ketosteroid isomerase-like protein
VVLALCLFAGCVPNRQIVYPTSGATGCSPNDIVISDIASQSIGNNEVQETWNADCLRQHFRCARSKGVTTCQEVTGDLAQPITRPPMKKDARPTTSADLTPAISPLIQQIWEAYRRGDATAHNAQLTDDYTAVLPDGSVHSGKPTAQEIQAAPIGVHILSDVRVVQTGPETALANYLATVEVPGENAKLVRFYVGELWVKQAGQWKCRYYQATLRR